jgi:hypothetical protein
VCTFAGLCEWFSVGNLAAWAQALLSAAAVYYAVRISQWQWEREYQQRKFDRLLSARGLANTLLSEIDQLKDGLYFSQTRAWAEDSSISLELWAHTPLLFTQMHVITPQQIIDPTDELFRYFLGDADVLLLLDEHRRRFRAKRDDFDHAIRAVHNIPKMEQDRLATELREEAVEFFKAIEVLEFVLKPYANGDHLRKTTLFKKTLGKEETAFLRSGWH